MTLRRIASEIKHLQNDPSETRSAHPISDKNIYHWTAKIIGPPESPYANRDFEFRIFLPETYPLIGPRMTFITPIFHPNVSSRGEVKLAELERSQWCPVVTVRLLLISVQAMLSDPNLVDGCILNEEAASLYVKDIDEFKRKASQLTPSSAV
jgi:ubiquitin-conjugating enzyme E2 D/E